MEKSKKDFFDVGSVLQELEEIHKIEKTMENASNLECYWTVHATYTILCC